MIIDRKFRAKKGENEKEEKPGRSSLLLLIRVITPLSGTHTH